MPASKKEAKEFVKRWQKRLAAIPAGSNNEQQDTQKFWVDLLINVLGIPSNTIDSFVDFERKVRGRRIDVFVSDHNFLCEQKSWGIDLDKPEPRNGGMETPLQQAMWYARHLPYSERPRWVMTCNFGTFRLYDLDNERPEDTVQEFSLEELQDSLYLLSFLTSNETSRLHKEQQLSIEAGAYVSRLYDALAKQYHHIEEKDERAQEEQRSLNVLITRIIFLLYAEDADLLQSHQAFGRYCEGDPAKLRRKLVDLFEAIDTPLDKRDEYMDEDLAAFPYVNGGLFADSSIIVPQMTPEILEAITDASQDFDWREISGVIFGGVFEGTLNPETRHAGGMHYTSVENIERCLKPLFLDELWDELHEAEGKIWIPLHGIILPACGGTANRSEVALTEGQKKGPGRLLRPGPNAQSSRPFWFSSALRSSSQNARIAVAIPRSVKRTAMPVERSTAKPSLPPLTFLMPPRDFEGKRYWRLPPLDLASSMPSRLSRRSSSPIRSGQSRMRPTSSILRATATRTRAFSERSACPFRAMSRSALPGCLAWTRELALPRSSCLRPYLSSRVRTVFTRDAAAFRAGPSSSLRPVSRSLRLMPRCTA